LGEDFIVAANDLLVLGMLFRILVHLLLELHYRRHNFLVKFLHVLEGAEVPELVVNSTQKALVGFLFHLLKDLLDVAVEVVDGPFCFLVHFV